MLEFSPAPHDPAVAGAPAPVDALDVTVESLLPQLEFHLFGAVAAIQRVLPAMIERGSGTIFVTTGAAHVVTISAWIGRGGTESDPDTIAQTYWDLYSTRNEAERLYSAPLPDEVY